MDYERKLVNLQVGDLVYARVQYAGCSYHYTFGRCAKITPTKKYRIEILPSKIAGEKREEKWYTWQPVEPDTVGKPVKTILVREDGYKNHSGTWSGLWFEKYTKDLKLENYSDGGD